MKDEFLLDASALMALIRGEPGADRVMEIWDKSVVHTVQVAEVVRKLKAAGVDDETCLEVLTQLDISLLERFEAGQAYDTARFCVRGMSLGDRICLAVADSLGLTAVTADRQWAEVGKRHGVAVQLIR